MKANLKKDDLLKTCKAVGCIGLSTKNSNAEIVAALNSKFGYDKFRICGSGHRKVYEIRSNQKGFCDYTKIKNSMKVDDEKTMICPCCHKELNHKKFKKLSGYYSKYCKDCRELKHGE